MAKKVKKKYSPTELKVMLNLENKAIGILEKNLLTEERTSTYIACEDFNFFWDMKIVDLFDKLWKEGQSLLFIADTLVRPIDEVTLLLFDRAAKGKVKPRGNGIWGI